jgi:hypothetical protein
MLKQTLRVIAVLSFLLTLAVPSTHAQSNSNITVTVPFEFKIAGKTLPAGEYIVRRSTQVSADGLMIRRTDCRAGVFLLTMSNQTAARAKDSKLVFHRYGRQYFLSQVWTSGRSNGRELFKSGQERALEREMPKNRSEREIVAIFGRQQ